MKITINGQIYDTDKMPDREADILEAFENYNKTCARYKVTSFATFILPNMEDFSCLLISEDKLQAALEGDMVRHILEVTLNNQ